VKLSTIAAGLLFLAGCREPEPTEDYFSWTNPITGAVVAMPEGWRQSPEIARRGETTVGYFTPNFSMMLGRYGHVTLHYEFMGGADGPATLERFVENFFEYMRHRSERLSEPVFEERNGLQTARLSAEVWNRDRQILLKVRFWTPNGRDFWYAAAESLIEDGHFAERAEPLIARLQRSCLAAK